MRMLTDNPIKGTNQDRFGFAPYARILAETISETDDLPFCVGIFGQWGAGKSSMMKMIEEYAASTFEAKTVWFNPWKYDRKENLWHALIQTILYEIAEGGDVTLKEKAKTLASHTAWFFLKKGISTLTTNVIDGKSLEKMKNAFTTQDELHHKHINEFEEHFTEAVNLYTNNGKLVVFIDDLDRCIPENAITVLESLKLFIGHANCVFVLGMDRHIVEKGIKKLYGEHVGMSGRDYMDKIIQVPFFLPPVPFDVLRQALNVTKTVEYSNAVWCVIELGLGSNPRKTKRFINCFYLLRSVLRAPTQTTSIFGEVREATAQLEPSLQEFYLAKLLVLQMQFADFYEFLSLHPEGWQSYELELIKAPEVDELDRFLNKNPNYKVFWENERLQTFMTSTVDHAQLNIPDPPEANVVKSLMKAMNLVGNSSYGDLESSSSSLDSESAKYS